MQRILSKQRFNVKKKKLQVHCLVNQILGAMLCDKNSKIRCQKSDKPVNIPEVVMSE